MTYFLRGLCFASVAFVNPDNAGFFVILYADTLSLSSQQTFNSRSRTHSSELPYLISASPYIHKYPCVTVNIVQCLSCIYFIYYILTLYMLILILLPEKKLPFDYSSSHMFGPAVLYLMHISCFMTMSLPGTSL